MYAVKCFIRIYRNYFFAIFNGKKDFFSHPVIVIFASIESVFRQYKHEHRSFLDSSLDFLTEDAIFQFVIIKKYPVSSLRQHQLEDTRILSTASSAITDKYIVLISHFVDLSLFVLHLVAFVQQHFLHFLRLALLPLPPSYLLRYLLHSILKNFADY